MRINNKFRYTSNFIRNDKLEGSGISSIQDEDKQQTNATSKARAYATHNAMHNDTHNDTHNIDKLIHNIQNNKQIELNEKIEREKRYLQILNDFLNDTYEYSICDFIKLDDINEDYKKYISQNIDKIKNFNGLYGLNFKDIVKLNPNYIKKDIEFCDFCNNKHFKNCCENYKSKNINKTRKGVSHRIRCIVNIKKK